MPKKKRNFFDWIKIRGIKEKNTKTSFTVPPHITQLPCGCKREKEDAEFLVKILNGKLVHDHYLCDEPLSMQESCLIIN